ncbi:hypothetical protein [Micromonospora profundi]|uniref:hypothetical protein n=1 Tax=Micromonospora profundi TaxID=1420889 RepID=UPI0036A68FCC
MTDALDYRFYGLSGNPYVNRELDPRREDDRQLLLELDVLPPLTQIREHIARAAAADESAAFLLSGRTGAGRTTLAHKIFDLYREEREIGDTFHVVSYQKIDHDSLARVNAVIKAIRNKISRNHPDRRDELMSRIPNAEGIVPDELDLQARADFLAEVAQSVRPTMHIGLLIDGVQDDAFMDALAVAFQYVPAVVVVTRDAYNTADTASAERLAERREWQRWARHLHLSPLSGSDVQRIATNRWHIAAGEVECPFEADGVRSTFDQRREPIGRAIRWLGWLLEGRLKTYEGDERWPAADELRMPARWIESMVQMAGKAPRDPEDDHVDRH